jgi:hypothetical protein
MFKAFISHCVIMTYMRANCDILLNINIATNTPLTPLKRGAESHSPFTPINH